jgi:CrcB protein
MTRADLLVAVGAGGALGAVLRATIYRAVERLIPVGSRGFLNRLGIAYATILVNVAGSLLLGLLLGWLPEWSQGAREWPRAFWITGICGSLSTFSTFCADAIGLVWRRDAWRLVAYLLANALLSVAAILLGLRVAG